ncbi:hypothetical protein [Anaeromassilibacillus senegalensis]|uniref:hypothetical protein n=1 Tax=Anaeromassilibacillus senegalensis TaxID=1673717 RepID=UPI000681AC96|nr:hypothetical protein [Anaeromassilibacillus senegalensis]
MGIFEQRFQKKEKKHRRNYEIDDDLFTKLEHMAQIFDASLTDLANACIEQLIEDEKIIVFEKPEHELPVIHTLLIRESNLAGLENLKEKYGVSIYKLVNIAIKNALEEYDI